MRKLTCHCEQVFNVDLPEVVNLDETPGIIAQIAEGSFLTCVCPTCNGELHTDLETRLEWPSKKTALLLLPEIERLNFLAGNRTCAADCEVVIGYPELADRVAVRAEGLDPLVVETLKYHLAAKALDSGTDKKIQIFFEKRLPNGDLEFHIHGLKDGEVAITVIPSHLYESIRHDAAEHPENDLYSSIQRGAYLSYQNILIEEGDND